MKILKLIFAALIISSIVFSCKEEDPESYEVRKREHRLFRFKIDGKEWTYTGKEYWGFFHHIRSAYYEEDSSLYIQAYYFPDKNTRQYINLYSKSGLKIGKNEISNRHTEIRGFRCYGCGMEPPFFETYYIEILDIDTINHIIVGTFEFNLKDGRDTATISDGEFDLKMDAWVK